MPASMSTEIGCPDHVVYATDRGGAPSLGILSPHIALTWNRRLDETSTASVTVSVDDAECCELLGLLRSWRNELVIYRGEERVWEGVITNITYGIEEVVIDAQDVSAWLGVRVAHEAINTVEEDPDAEEPPVTETIGPIDAGTYLEMVIKDALRPDDPNILPYLQISAAGETVERETTVDETVALDELNQVGEYAVDWTVLGRRIIIGKRTVPDGYIIGPLIDKHFGAGLTLSDVGTAAATRVIADGEDEDVSVGGVDPYYGLIERKISPKGVTNADELQLAAEQYLAEANPPPLVIANNGAIQILPSAPVGINELIPGAYIRVAIRELCRELITIMVIFGVDVSEGSDDEQVSITLLPPGEITKQEISG